MRILFYLPVVTPWWFEKIILLLVEKLATENEVHILAPVFWQGTGLAQREYDLCAHLPQVVWHIVSDKDHRSMRTDAVQREQIIEFVQGLDPDFVLCRSADFKTLEGFPGIVRHITEGGADPLLLPVGAVHFAARPFDHGILPSLSKPQIAKLDALMEPYWEPLVNAPEAQLPAQNAFREWARLPYDRPTLFLPLEYEHHENFYTLHRDGPTPNASLVEELIGLLDGRVFLALTNHPLNDLYVDNNALSHLVEAYPEDLRLLPSETPSGLRTTPQLMRAADGVLLGDSKSYTLAGFCGTPILRRSRFATGDWLNAYDDLETFVTAVGRGNVKRPDTNLARIWFAFHAANNLVSPRDPELTGGQLLERLTQPFDPGRWDKNIEVFAEGWTQKKEIAA